MKYLIAILIFFLVLFIYLHVQYHFKTSDDLEVYTIENPSKEKMEEICDIRQPVILAIDIRGVRENCNILTLDDNYRAFDVKIRNNDFNDDLFLKREQFYEKFNKFNDGKASYRIFKLMTENHNNDN